MHAGQTSATIKSLSALQVQWNLYLSFPDPSFNFYGPWANPISSMAPASIVFPDPLFLFQTPDENDESRFHCTCNCNWTSSKRWELSDEKEGSTGILHCFGHCHCMKHSNIHGLQCCHVDCNYKWCQRRVFCSNDKLHTVKSLCNVSWGERWI
jgi:hypothetical protein